MALLIPRDNRKRVGFQKGIKDSTYLGCPETRNRTPWCFRMCKLNADGTGLCGRVAPHGFKSTIQQGIEDYEKRKANASTLLRHQKPTCRKDA